MQDAIQKRLEPKLLHGKFIVIYRYNLSISLGRFQITGEPLVRRADDNPETLKKRLKAYHSQTSPLVQYYSSKKIHTAVDASRDPKSIFQGITAIFDGMKGKKLVVINQP